MKRFRKICSEVGLDNINIAINYVKIYFLTLDIVGVLVFSKNNYILWKHTKFCKTECSLISVLNSSFLQNFKKKKKVSQFLNM